jgi:hypothetical protein
VGAPAEALPQALRRRQDGAAVPQRLRAMTMHHTLTSLAVVLLICRILRIWRLQVIALVSARKNQLLGNLVSQESSYMCFVLVRPLLSMIKNRVGFSEYDDCLVLNVFSAPCIFC